MWSRSDIGVRSRVAVNSSLNCAELALVLMLSCRMVQSRLRRMLNFVQFLCLGQPWYHWWKVAATLALPRMRGILQPTTLDQHSEHQKTLPCASLAGFEQKWHVSPSSVGGHASVAVLTSHSPCGGAWLRGDVEFFHTTFSPRGGIGGLAIGVGG